MSYEAEILQRRAERAQALQGDRSWLTLAGLYWLQAGANRFGAGVDNDLVLTSASVPEYAGVFYLDDGNITLEVATGVTMTRNGEPISTLVMQHDHTPAPDFVTVGDVTMLIIKRGQRYAIRLWDIANPARQAFAGLHWYSVNPAWRVTARFVPYDAPRTLAITTLHGDIEEAQNPGYVVFDWQGQECVLDAEATKTGLFFNFRDQTNSDTTYPPGRFLITGKPENGEVVLDFNQATNPYCAYTDYATCPLPPPRNRLPVRVEAGEMRYHA